MDYGDDSPSYDDDSDGFDGGGGIGSLIGSGRLFPFHAYSPAKEVNGQLVYVNYAKEEDFKRLKEGQNMPDVEGNIVIAREGKIYR